MKKRLWVIQERGWYNGRWSKWEYNFNYHGFFRDGVIRQFMDSYNDPIGYTNFTDLKGCTRVKPITVEFPE